MTLSFNGGRIEGDVTIFEAWNCGAICAVDQPWSRTVTQATRRFHDLVGGSVSGGGLLSLDALTFELVNPDEVL